MGGNYLYIVVQYKEKGLGIYERMDPKNIKVVNVFKTRDEICQKYFLTLIDVMNIIQYKAKGLIPCPTKTFLEEHDIFTVFGQRPYIFTKKIRKAIEPYYKFTNHPKYL